MPQAIAAAAAWVGSTVMTAVGTTLTATGVTAAIGGASALGIAHGVAMFAYTVSEIALWAGMSYAVDSALKPKLKPPGSELQFNMDPAYPREMIIGQRLVGGSMVARYSRGSNLYNAHMVIQVADHPCVELSKVYDAGRVVRDTPLTHGTRTEITAYSNSGGARVWMTWWDGRPGQTADTDLITKSAQDPDVVAGKLPGWSSEHVGAGCAYIHVEVQWDSDILTSIPQFTWLVKGARLYDRRLDTTAGGSGSHRLNDPSTWEYTDNAAVAADHYLLGYKVEDDDLAFGIGLHPSEVPYEIFANAADLADEDVETGTGDDVETIKRYVVNGVVSAAEYFQDVLEAFQMQMAGRFVDLGGRIGFLGAEEREISLDLSDQDLTSDDQMQFADKLSFDDLYGSVSGTFADPANLYQQTPYETQYTPYNALPDGGEAQQIQIALPYEVHPRRAVRNVSAWLKRESLQPRLIGIFMAKAWRLEAGDWFTFTSERLQLDMAKFEVIDIAKHDDFTVTITARAIDPEFLAFSVDDDPDLSVPPEVEPASLYLDAPEFDIEESSIADGDILLPAFLFTLTSDEVVAREVVIEYGLWVAGDIAGPTQSSVMHVDQVSMKLAEGVLPGKTYAARAKVRVGGRESPWTNWSAPIDAPLGYAVGEAASVEWENVQDGGGTRPADNATVGARSGTNLYRTDGTTVLTQAEVRTAEGVAASIASQGGLATLNFTTLGTNVRLADGSTSATNALLVTSLGVAASIASQGSLATISRANVVALSGSEALNNALVPAGANGLVDTDFRWQTTYWYKDSQSGSTAWSTGTSSGGLRRSIVTGSGLTVGHYARQGSFNQRSLFSCKAGDAVGARVLAGGDNLSTIELYLIFRDAAGTNLGSPGYAAVSSGILAGDGEEASFNEVTVVATAPSGTVSATLEIRGIASTSAPVVRMAKPLLSVLPSGQTVAPRFAPGREHEIGANVTETRTAAAFTGQGGLATLSFVTIGTNLRRADGTTSATESLIVTSLGTASAIASQGSLATINYVTFGSNVRRSDGSTTATDADYRTSLGVAASITGQGAFATRSAVVASLTTEFDPSNMILDSDLLDSAYWSVGSGWVFGTTEAPEVVPDLGVARGIRSAVGNGTTSQASTATDTGTTVYMGVEPGASYRVSAKLNNRSGFTGQARIGIMWYDRTKTLIGLPGYVFGNNYQTTPSAGVIQTISGVLLAPAGAVYARFRTLVEWSTTQNNASRCYFGNLRMHRAPQLGNFLTREDGTTLVTDATAVTSLGTAAGFTGQGALATLNTINSSSLMGSGVVTYTALASTAVRLGTNIVRNDGTTSATDAMLVTSLGVASAITSQGGLATLNFATLGTNVRLADGTTVATNALLVTSLGVASSVTSQGALCTLNYVQFNSTVRLQDGTTIVTDALVVTASGTAAAIASQGALATLNAVGTSQISSGAVTGADDDETDAGQNVGSSWVAVADCSLTTVDAASRALIMFSAYIESSTDGSLMEARIKRDSTVIWGPKSIAGDPPEFSETFEDEGLIEYRPMFNGMVSFFDTDVPGSAATYTYSVELRVPGSVTTPWVASYRRMFGMIFKR